MSADVIQLGELDGPLLVFGGPYSNLQATRAVKQVAEELDIPANRTVCTGDIIAYCGAPCETLELIRDWGIHVVKGNCEESLGSGALDCGCGFEAGSSCSLLSVDWYGYALGKINAEQQSWMSYLPTRINLGYNGRSIAIVHGGLDLVNRFVFPSTPAEEKERELDLAQADVVIGGHSGIPFGQRIGQRAWLNSGAIGMPANDGTKEGWYLLLTSAGTAIQASWQRLAYDVQGAFQDMLAHGLVGGYRYALNSGLWPSTDVLPELERKKRGVPLVLEDLLF